MNAGSARIGASAASLLPLAAVLGTAFITALIQIPWHEGAHWVACESFDGSGCALFFNFAPGRVPDEHRALHLAAGPAASLLLAVLAAWGSHVSRHWMALPAAYAVSLVSAARSLSLAAIYFGSGDWLSGRRGFDEVALAQEVGAWPALVVAAVVLLFLLCVWIVAKQVPATSRLSWTAAVIGAGALGTIVWLRVLGPAVLPWR